jgi:hypothetical protein
MFGDCDGRLHRRPGLTTYVNDVVFTLAMTEIAMVQQVHWTCFPTAYSF